MDPVAGNKPQPEAPPPADAALPPIPAPPEAPPKLPPENLTVTTAPASLPIEVRETVAAAPVLNIPMDGRGIGASGIEIAKALRTEFPSFDKLPAATRQVVIDAFKPGGLLNIGDILVAKSLTHVVDKNQAQLVRADEAAADGSHPVDEAKVLAFAATLRQPAAVIQAALEVCPDAKDVRTLREALVLIQILAIPSNRRELDHLSNPPPLDRKTIDQTHLAAVVDEAIKVRNFMDELRGNGILFGLSEMSRLMTAFGTFDELELAATEALDEHGERGFQRWYNEVTGLDETPERMMSGPARSRRNRFRAD
jgi:hypothetical protein